jgi:hypothetical protein
MADTLRQLLLSLTRDKDRPSRPFSEGIRVAHDVLLNPYATDPERTDAMNCWLQRFQPCLFGVFAAKARGIQYCFVTEQDIVHSDEAVVEKIQRMRRYWKRRASKGQPVSGFMLSVLSPHIAFAAADENLRAFAQRVQDLVGWDTLPDDTNEIVTESLYLLNPTTTQFHRFRFSVDFFASAGDGIWWQDHRVPGGIAFTANSVGHMLKVKEWYEGDTDSIEWALRVAMLTIANAAETPHGPATWLLPVNAAGPYREFQWNEKRGMPDQLAKLKGKDCGSYAGTLHTDHAIRAEFFDPAGDPRPPRRDNPWLMDFAYLFDGTSADHIPFVAGEPVATEEVEAVIGKPSDADWRSAAADEIVAAPTAVQRRGIDEALAVCRSWEISDEAFKAMT